MNRARGGVNRARGGVNRARGGVNKARDGVNSCTHSMLPERSMSKESKRASQSASLTSPFTRNIGSTFSRNSRFDTLPVRSVSHERNKSSTRP